MRKLYRCLFLLSAIALAGGLWSCSDDDDKPGGNGGNSTIGVEAPAQDAVYATSATFKLKTKGAESYVSKAVEGANAADPDPIVAYAEAQENDEVVTVSGDTDEAIVAGLEGNKTYTVFFIFKVGDKYEIYSQQINTPAYSQRVTLIKTDMFSVTFHVEVPADEYYIVNFLDIETYESYKSQFGRTDVDYVLAGYGVAQPRYKGPQNITIKNGTYTHAGALNEKDYIDMAEGSVYAVHPGTGYVLFVSQCAEDGSTEAFSEWSDNGGGGDILGSKLPNLKNYTEEPPSNEMVSFTGNCAKTTLFTQEPKKGSGNVLVNVDRLTEKSAVISFTPSDDILQYIIMMLPETEKVKMTEFIGGEDGWQAFVLNNGDAVDGARQGTFLLEPDVNYSLSIVGIYAEDGTVQTYQEVKNIKTIKSDKPAAELQVTPLTMEDPYHVGYNIKAINADCVAFRYLLNYTKEWYPMLNQLEGDNQENKIASLLASYGQGINDPEVMSKINSSEGYDMFFSSMDDTESWLVLESYNVDEKTKLFYDGSNYRTMSASVKPGEPVNSELFSKLQGSWMATMTRGNGDGKVVTMPVTIAAGPEHIASLPEDVKTALVTYYMEQKEYTEAKANEAVNSYFKEYQERVGYYTQKYRNMNCLVATGFEYDSYNAPLATPWDLFQSTEYSAYSTDELFRDYGPKLFLQISKDVNGKDVVTVITTRYDENGGYNRYIDPVSDWYKTLNFNAYYAETPNSIYIADFPVEVSADMNTITIMGVEQDGISYTPGFTMEEYAGYPAWDFLTKAGIVLTRATANDMKKATSRSSFSKVQPKVSARSGNHFRRTRAPYGFEAKKAIKGTVFSMDDYKKDLKK